MPGFKRIRYLLQSHTCNLMYATQYAISSRDILPQLIGSLHITLSSFIYSEFFNVCRGFFNNEIIR